ncbi:MAG: hypothetical protein AUK44_05460 [Porphyromonadaceae bacterium CG2_30_38_12]|nr:MAG: hypothetical protein AUK44_05460 [Porphyromonadaceae bacterium CG2_30_38_12]
MRKVYLLSLLFIVTGFAIAQQPLINKIPKDLFRNFSIGLAFGAGPENGLSIIPPKLSLYYYEPEKTIEKYAAVEFSTFLLSLISADVLVGVRKNIFSFDTSLSYFITPSHYDDWEGQYYKTSSHFALNPKIGLKLGWFWFKGGPSFIFMAKNPNGFATINQIGNLYYNFEIALHIPFKIPYYKKIALYNITNSL